MAAVLIRAEGSSTITDRVFPERFWYAPEMTRLGAKIKVEIPSATVSGTDKLWAAEVAARDLRGAAALVIAALQAEGETIIRNSAHLRRGYEDLLSQLRSLGADVTSDDTPEDSAGDFDRGSEG